MRSTAIREVITQCGGTCAIFNLGRVINSQSKDETIEASACAPTSLLGTLDMHTRTPKMHYYILRTVWQKHDLVPH